MPTIKKNLASKKDFTELVKLQNSLEKKDAEATKALNKFLLKYKSMDSFLGGNKKDRLKLIKSFEKNYNAKIKQIKKFLS